MDQEVKLNLRLPAQEHQRLKQIAKKSRRSLHAEILFRLEESLAEPARADAAAA